jgi:hypothetical protein
MVNFSNEAVIRRYFESRHSSKSLKRDVSGRYKDAKIQSLWKDYRRGWLTCNSALIESIS